MPRDGLSPVFYAKLALRNAVKEVAKRTCHTNRKHKPPVDTVLRGKDDKTSTYKSTYDLAENTLPRFSWIDPAGERVARRIAAEEEGADVRED